MGERRVLYLVRGTGGAGRSLLISGGRAAVDEGDDASRQVSAPDRCQQPADGGPSWGETQRWHVFLTAKSGSQ